VSAPADVLTSPPAGGRAETLAIAAAPEVARPDGARALAPRAAEGTWVRACIAVDAMMLGGAIATAELGAARAVVPSTPNVWLLLFPLLVGALMWSKGMYALRLSLRALDDVRAIGVATTVAAMAILTCRVLISGDAAAADQTMRLWAFASVYLIGGRAVLSWSEASARRRGETLRPTLVVGTGRVGRLLAHRLTTRPEFGLRPVAYLDDLPQPGESLDLPIAGRFEDVEPVVREYGIEHVILTFSLTRDVELVDLFERCQRLGLTVSVVPRLYEEVTDRVSVQHVGGVPLLTAHHSDPRGWQFAVKYALDRVFAALGIVLTLPILAACALGVWVAMGRPIFFRQVRVGRDGRTFEMLKFRSMTPGPEVPRTGSFPLLLPPGSAPGGVEGCDRRTRVGSFLRRSSLDELPQLFNVLKGEMSIVGPRPERPEFAALFARDVHGYGARCRVKAGITGWAQVHGLRGKTSIADRAEWDNYYIDNFSLWLDVKIMLQTIGVVASSAKAVE
jgi:exopolysaccharide biosynthesis polyprenyl glycosylphosphotransferase